MRNEGQQLVDVGRQNFKSDEGQQNVDQDQQNVEYGHHLQMPIDHYLL